MMIKYKKLPENIEELIPEAIDYLQSRSDIQFAYLSPLILRMKVLENKKIVVDQEPFLRHQYESITMREDFDFSVRKKAMPERRFLLKKS